MADTVFSLAFDEARRAITQQQTALESLRTRAVVVFSAASVAISVFSVPNRTSSTVVSAVLRLVSIGLAMSIAYCTVDVLRPRDWTFSNNVRRLVGKADAKSTDVDGAYRNLALYMQGHWEKNAITLNRMTRRYEAACWCLAVLVAVRVAIAL